jgi:hypothetical protein
MRQMAVMSCEGFHYTGRDDLIHEFVELFTMKIRKAILRLLVLGMILGVPAIISACGSNQSESNHMSDMPADVQEAPDRVQKAYQYAFNHRDVLSKYPCYCGCVNVGHTNNLTCYIADVNAQGKVTYDIHAVSCGVCVDITHDVMRLMGEDQSNLQIREYIDAKYSAFGPSTDTLLPVE